MKRIFFQNLIILSTLVLAACSATNPINDFFGIQMNPEEEKDFKIINYNELDGVTYQSSRNMDASISAWAEIGVKSVRLKIVNNSKQNIPMNYNTDQFVIITNEKPYVLEKGERVAYFSQTSIKPNSAVELILKLPKDYILNFNQKYETSSGSELTKYILKDFTKLGNQQNVNKDNIRYILIKLGDRVLLLKRVPEELAKDNSLE